MKFIVSSVHFADKIKSAILNKAHTVYSNNKQLIFEGDDTRQECHVEFLEKQRINEDFRPGKWEEVFKYLQSIPEQPITVVISHTSIDIYCVKTFIVI